MRAIVIHDTKDLRVEERDVGQPGTGEVLVRLAIGGVCGSDLHYYNHGGFGTVRLKEPMILGHEVSGHVEAVGDGVDSIKVGSLVSVLPSRPCGNCRYCLEGAPNHCLNMRFYGSAMPFPHIQGAFQELLLVDVGQCVNADGLEPGEAAMAEPLSVGLHATRRAGQMLGKKVLITGCGPIGALCILAARSAGAAEIVVTDLSPNALSYAEKVGADQVINVGENPEILQEYSQGKGHFDVLYECSGTQQALSSGMAVMRPQGVILQLGLGGDMNIPMMLLTSKELEIRGSFRFHEEFFTAVELMRKGRINVKPLISHTLPLKDARVAFDTANDRSQAMKTQISFA